MVSGKDLGAIIKPALPSLSNLPYEKIMMDMVSDSVFCLLFFPPLNKGLALLEKFSE